MLVLTIYNIFHLEAHIKFWAALNKMQVFIGKLVMNAIIIGETKMYLVN